jgi:hypothetical protein
MTVNRLNQAARQLGTVATAVGALDRRLRGLERAANTAQIPGLGYAPPVLEAYPSSPVEMRDSVILEPADMTKLGRALRHDYFSHPKYPDREIRIDSEVVSIALGDLLRVDKVLIHAVRKIDQKVEEERPEGKEFAPVRRRVIPSVEVDVHWKASVVPAGTLADAQRKEAAAEARKRPRPEPIRVHLAPHMPSGRGMLAWLAKQGIGLAVEHGLLIVSADRGRLDARARQAIRDCAPPLLGWLTNQPVACYRGDAEAVTLLEPGTTPACAAHAGRGR